MFLKSDDADLFVTSFGSGPRTIVAHGGWVGSGELWQQPFEQLSRRWRTVTYDHLGTGATRFIEGCKANFEATMEMFVNACTPDDHCEAERGWGKQIVMRSDCPSAVQLMECLEPVQLEDRLSQIQLPTLLIHGSRDIITPIASSQNLAQQLPNSKLVTIEGAGHVPTVTRPAEVVRAIEEFFATDTL